MLLVSIVIIIIATLLGIIKEINSHKGEKMGILKAIWTYLPMFLMVIGLRLSIYKVLDDHGKNLTAAHKREQEFQNIMGISGITLRKADTNLVKSDIIQRL
jgi:hypothetical protein